MIELLDGSRGDYHPTRLGDKLNEVIECLNTIDPKLSSALTDIDSLTRWKTAHEKLTLERFEKELLELLTKPESKVYQQLKEMFRKEVWYKEEDNDK